VSFSGANLNIDSTAEGKKVKADGYMNSLKVAVSTPMARRSKPNWPA
jgi:hypothetical protein